jgi:hypothetical protein
LSFNFLQPSRATSAMYLNFLLFVTEDHTFHKFIILTMMLPFAHDSAIRWEEVLGVL